MARLLMVMVAAVLALSPASVVALHAGRVIFQTSGSRAVRIQKKNASVAAASSAVADEVADGIEDEQLPDDYVARAAAVESKCRSLKKCVDLCAWVKRAFLRKYGSAEKAFAAADADGDGDVSNEDFVAQCIGAGVTDAAMSTRGYIFLYIVDISLSGSVSLESYQRIFMLAEAGGGKEERYDHAISRQDKREIENSDDWDGVKRKADFTTGAPVQRLSRAEPLSHADNAARPNAAERLATTTLNPPSHRPPPRPQGRKAEEASHGDRSAARGHQQHRIVALIMAVFALVFPVAR